MTQQPQMIGVTGPTGSGKTAVGRELERRGYAVIDADLAARAVVEKGRPCLGRLAGLFGEGILAADGSLDRRALGRLVFADEASRGLLEGTIFPYIFEEIATQAASLLAQGHTVVFLDAPTLIESGFDTRCAKVVAVTAPPEERLRRILARDGITPGEARSRMSAQKPDAFYLSRSHAHIVNDAGPGALPAKVARMLEDIGLD